MGCASSILEKYVQQEQNTQALQQEVQQLRSELAQKDAQLQAMQSASIVKPQQPSHAPVAGPMQPSGNPAYSPPSNGAPSALPPPQVYPPPGQTTTLGPVQVLFFPDSSLPCRQWRQDGQCRRKTCDFSHEPTSFSRFLDALGSAKRTLDICVFTITNDDIADVVLNLHRQGVKVRVITDDDQSQTAGSDAQRFKDAGIPVRMDADQAHMHHKFCVIDGQMLINGSFNWSRQAVVGNQENVMIVQNAQLAAQFTQQFERLWLKFKDN